MGGTLSSEQAHRISVDAETLPLRVGRCSAAALMLTRWLRAHPAVAKVHYPGLESHPLHDVARRLFGAGSWLLSVELRDPTTMIYVLDRLQLPIKATGLGDTRTLIIPVAPTIFREAGAEARVAMGIADGLVRVSVGLKEAAELISDFGQALG